MVSFNGFRERNMAGIPDQMPIKYKWSQVKDKISEEEFEELNNLVENSMNWAGENDPDYIRWKELDKKAWPYGDTKK